MKCFSKNLLFTIIALTLFFSHSFSQNCKFQKIKTVETKNGKVIFHGTRGLFGFTFEKAITEKGISKYLIVFEGEIFASGYHGSLDSSKVFFRFANGDSIALFRKENKKLKFTLSTNSYYNFSGFYDVEKSDLEKLKELDVVYFSAKAFINRKNKNGELISKTVLLSPAVIIKPKHKEKFQTMAGCILSI